MKCFVAIKTLRKEPFPSILGVKDSLEVDFKGYRYDIMKYWE